MRLSLSLMFLISQLTIHSCISAQNAVVQFTDKNIPFALHQPTYKVNLAPVLAEISGLDYHNGLLLAVQDELGEVFFLHRKTGKIENQLTLFGPGDSEGIATYDQTILLNTSDGLIYSRAMKDNTKTELLGAALPGGGDYEALEWDPVSKKLLIATKDNLKGEDFPGKNRYIFSVGPKAPFNHHILFPIDYSSIRAYLQVDSNDIIRYSNLNVAYDKPKPSGLAIDPLSSIIYVLNDSGKMLLTYSKDGELLGIALLNEKIFQKPEGIAFDPSGNLYISNEQKAQPANILFFQRQE